MTTLLFTSREPEPGHGESHVKSKVFLTLKQARVPTSITTLTLHRRHRLLVADLQRFREPYEHSQNQAYSL